MKPNKNIHMVAYFLLILGGLNWLLLGFFGWEIGSIFGGSDAIISKIIYILVGLAALYELTTHKHTCKVCGAKKDRGHAHPAETTHQDS